MTNKTAINDEAMTKLLTSWDRIRNAIGAVSVSLPSTMSEAMAELMESRKEMDSIFREVIMSAIKADRED
jgi:hypothetical protein